MAQAGARLISASSAGSTTLAGGGAVLEKGHLFFLAPLLLLAGWASSFSYRKHLTSPIAAGAR